MDTTLFDTAMQAESAHENIYGAPRLTYKRAAVIASHKLGRNVTEYDIASVQIAFIESLLAVTKADPKLYAEMIRLLTITSEFASMTADNFSPTNLTAVQTNLEDALAESTKNIAKMFAPFTKKDDKSDDGPSAA